jgi:peptidoglycan/xylan/chitin deacetylase (PgdA/CDA1 family)
MIRGIGKIKRVYRKIKSKFIPSAIILLYHRVAELPTDPQLLAVTPQHFAEHLEILGLKAYPIPLQQLVKVLKEGNIPKRGVVVTFDDGYADNLENAKPQLERYNIPATIFISAGAVGNVRPFWWDELEALLLRPGKLPETLQLNVNGDIMAWKLGETAVYHEKDYWKNRSWSVMEKTDPSLRHGIYRSLLTQMRPIPSSERQKILDELLAWAGAQSTDRPDYLPLTPDEMHRLEQGGLVEVGAHTMTHPVLSTLPPTAQQIEIQQSKTELEKVLGHSVTSFSYPFGSRSDYTMETVGIVREAGFACACSNFPEVIWNGTDLFQLPRILVRDWDGDTFARMLRSWWGD